MKQLNKIANDIFILDDFLTEKECIDFINFSEDHGFTSADVETKNGKQVISYIRNNDRVDHYSEELSQRLWSKLSAFQLPTFDFMNAIALSPYFRFYKYVSGQKFNMHKDGQQQVGENISYFTFIVYLNENCIGGSTKFRLDDISIKPKTGSLLIFEHRLWHQGEEVISGEKYILRTDIVYETIGFETYLDREKAYKSSNM